MAITQLSPVSVQASPVDVNPQVKADQATSPYQVNQGSNKAILAIKSDTVTISPQAIQKLANDGDAATKEVKESGVEKAAEKVRGKY